jgi:hypothetical protein
MAFVSYELIEADYDPVLKKLTQPMVKCLRSDGTGIYAMTELTPFPIMKLIDNYEVGYVNGRALNGRDGEYINVTLGSKTGNITNSTNFILQNTIFNHLQFFSYGTDQGMQISNFTMLINNNFNIIPTIIGRYGNQSETNSSNRLRNTLFSIPPFSPNNNASFFANGYNFWLAIGATTIFNNNNIVPNTLLDYYNLSLIRESIYSGNFQLPDPHDNNQWTVTSNILDTNNTGGSSRASVLCAGTMWRNIEDYKI